MDNIRYRNPFRDPDRQKLQSERIQFPSDMQQADDITPRRNSYQQQPPDNGGASFSSGQSPAFSGNVPYEEPSYREHVSGKLAPSPTSDSRPQQAYSPGYQQPLWPTAYAQQPQVQQPQPPVYAQPSAYAQPQQPGAYPPNGAYYPGYYPNYYAPPQQVANYGQGNYPYPGYYGYPPYPYYYQPQKPRRDGYLLGINIAALVCSSIVALGGLLLLLLTVVVASQQGTASGSGGQLFSGVVLFTALTIASLTGGGFGIYHSVRSLIHKRSGAFKLSWLWVILFLAFYIVVAIIGAFLSHYNASVSNIPFTMLLIALAGLLPAATILALGVRRLSVPLQNLWSTTWRRFTFAVVSGATSAILFAGIAEEIISVVLGISLGITGFSLDNPNQVINNPKDIVFMFLLLSVVAPLVEESVKPLAAILLIRRVSSAAEAFTLGLACGIGFDLIETSGYISQGYQSWLNVALERSTAGLLHGFGAAMTTLGWYIITHPGVVERRRYLLGFGCILYAILQHAIWNGSVLLLVLLPAPIGPFFDHGTFLGLDAGLLPYIVLSILMLAFFVFVTGKVRKLSNKNKPDMPAPQQFPQGMPAPMYAQ